MRILAVDPNQQHAAAVIFDTTNATVVWHEDIENNLFIRRLGGASGRGCVHECEDGGRHYADLLAIEMIEARGMAVGRETFETCVQVGRIVQRWESVCGCAWQYVYRSQVKDALCGSRRAKESNIHQAILDKFGGRQAKGTKAAPGPLYGITGHKWAALAVAVTAAIQLGLISGKPLELLATPRRDGRVDEGATIDSRKEARQEHVREGL